jgi:histone-binding protein RBBP4
MTHSLEWPSLTCQWLPKVRSVGPKSNEHSLLLGTHTTGEQNYLMVASCNLPKEDAVIDNRENNSNNNNDNSVPAAPAYDDEKKEVGGFGHADSTVGKIEIRMKVLHQGEVNRARVMPQNEFMVATRGPDPEVYVFDLSKQTSFPEDGSTFSPNIVCLGHSKEGYAIAWSHLKDGYLLSGSEDTNLCLWDINAGANSGEKTGRQVKALSTFKGHTAVVEDVDWHAKDSNLIGSVSDDKSIRLWDIRDPSKAMNVVENAHESDINCISFNPKDENIFATGSADKTVALWDIRNLKS